MDLSDLPGGLACPSRASSWGHAPTPWDLPCCVALPVQTCRRQYPGETVAGIVSLPCRPRRRPSPSPCWLGSHIWLFEACSAFTHVTACLLAEPPGGPLHRRLRRFLTSTAAPIATGWSESCRVGIAPTEDRRLCTAHKMTSQFKWSPLILT